MTHGARPSGAELALLDAGLWVHSTVGAALLVAGLLLLQGGQLFGVALLAAVVLFALEIVRRMALIRILGARGVLTQGLLIHQEDDPKGESAWWSGHYEFHVEGRRYEHRVSSFMFSPRSSYGTVVGILFDPVDPDRALVRGRFDRVDV